MERIENDINYVNEEDDVGCIVGCVLSDTLQDVISSLVGGYSLLCLSEKESTNPDNEKLKKWDMRREEIHALSSYYFCKPFHKYNDIRRWIEVYAKELKELDKLRKQYEKISC